MLLLTNRSYQPFLTLCEIHFPSTDQIFRPKFCQNEHFGDILDILVTWIALTVRLVR